jgi:phosphohistidine phosphatase
MMRQLLLLRHAKSSWDEPKLPDHARPLNERGRQTAAALRPYLRDSFEPPQLVLVSSARRTLQTLQALGHFGPETRVTPLDSLYLANMQQLLHALNGVDEAVQRVLLIGHNPGLHELAMRLATAHAMSNATPELERLTERFPTCALAAFSVAGPWWSVGDGGTRLVRFVVPRDLPELAA